MISTEQIVDLLLKLIQISFYIVASIIAILTYRSAKKGLLNTVNTEYQKKVISRLDEIAKELGSEFDPKSPNYWANHNPIKEIVSQINEAFSRNRKYVLEQRDYPFGIPVSSDVNRITRLLAEIKSDPFIPSNIREATSEFLENRANTLSEIYYTAAKS